MVTGSVQSSENPHVSCANVGHRVGTPEHRVGNSFPRSSKLLKHALFDQVYKRGQRHFSGLMTVFFLRREQEESSFNEPTDSAVGETPTGQPAGRQRSKGDCSNGAKGARVGFTVGRVLGNSVARNRIRRRMREAVRFNLDLLPNDVDVVINPKKQVLEAEFPKIVAEVERAFKKASSVVGR